MPVTKLNLYIFENESKGEKKSYPIRTVASDMVHKYLIFQSDASRMFHHYHIPSFLCSIIKSLYRQDNSFKKYFLLNKKYDSYLNFYNLKKNWKKKGIYNK